MPTWLRRRWVAIIARIIACLYAAIVQPVLAEESQYARIGSWSILYKQLNNFNACSAYAHYADGTDFELMLAQTADGREWAIFLSNPRWSAWIKRGSEHRLRLVTTTKIWNGVFSVSSKKEAVYLVGPSISFLDSLVKTSALIILDDDAHPLVSGPLSMKDSRDAIRSVVDCVGDHPFKGSTAPEAKTPDAEAFGTAFFVAPNLLVTNNHVVKDCRNAIQVRYPNSGWHSVTVSGRDDTNDLALLHTDFEGLAVALFRLQPEVGEAVAAYGFPYAGLLSSSGNFTTGTLAALSGLNDDSRFIQTSAPMQPGNSGGPLIDMSGSVIGVVEGQLSALAMMRFTGTVPQNVNFAIQSPIVVNFLVSKGQTPKTENSVAHSDLPPAQVADLTVQVHCGGQSSETADNPLPGPQGPALPGPASAPSSLEHRAKDFALSIQDLWSRPNAETFPALDELYEDEVIYFGKKMSREAVLKVKRAFANRFPQREYKPRSLFQFGVGETPARFTGLLISAPSC
jgi:S1-C subfamily serine protease